MLMFTPENTLWPQAHDFSAGPDAAMKAALEDMAYYGVGQLSHAFEEDVFYTAFDVADDERTRKDGRPVGLTNDLGPLIESFAGFTALYHQGIDAMEIQANVRKRNGSEGLHIDDSFKRRQVGSEEESRFSRGVRMLAQLEGPDGALAVVSTNRKINQVLRNINGKDVLAAVPARDAKFVIAPYLTGSAILLPESPKKALRVQSAEGDIVELEHAYHTGVRDAEDGESKLLIVDFKMSDDNFIIDLHMPRGKMRSTT